MSLAEPSRPVLFREPVGMTPAVVAPRPSLDYLMLQAHIAWARRYYPWLLKKAA